MPQLRAIFSASNRDAPIAYQKINHTSMLQCILGTISLIIGSLARIYLAEYQHNRIGAGIWTGIFAVTTGIYGFRSVRKMRDKHAAATRFRVFSVLTTCVSVSWSNIWAVLLWQYLIGKKEVGQK